MSEEQNTPPNRFKLRHLTHGSPLTEEEAYMVGGWPEYAEDWAITPLPDGRLVLAYADFLSLEDLKRSNEWHELQTALMDASVTMRGNA